MKKILIADDHDHVRNALKNLFTSESGFCVCGEARNGKEAVERAITLTPDLIVLDISMPVMNGLEAAQILKRSFPEMLIILFTAHKTKFADAYAAASGASAVLSKDDGIRCLVRQARTLLYKGTPLAWSCPVCGLSGTVECVGDNEFMSAAVKANHSLVSPDCINSEHLLDSTG